MSLMCISHVHNSIKSLLITHNRVVWTADGLIDSLGIVFSENFSESFFQVLACVLNKLLSKSLETFSFDLHSTIVRWTGRF